MRKDYTLTARRVLTAVLACVAMISAYSEEKIDLTPRLHGTFRARWEGGLDGEGSRFQVRNARVSIDGAVAPGIDYFFQTDLCDRGKMKILDAWGRIAIIWSLFRPTLRGRSLSPQSLFCPFRSRLQLSA